MDRRAAGDRPDWEACAKPFLPEHLAERLARKVKIV